MLSPPPWIETCAERPPQLSRGGPRGTPDRPTLSGPEAQFDDPGERFRVHFTGDGADAVRDQDSNADGVPDDVERVAAAIDAALGVLETEGFAPILPDEDGRLDLYLREIDANGYAWQLATDGGPGSCFVEIDPSLVGDGEAVLESVVGHELVHCAQYAYTSEGPAWISESTATWVQYRHWSSPTLAAARDFLWNVRLRGFDRPVDSTGGRYEYASMVLWDHWLTSGGAAAGLPELWSALAEHGDWRLALDSESDRIWGRPYARTFGEFAEWATFACARSDGRWELPCDLPAVQVDLRAESESFPIALPAVSHTASFHRLDGYEPGMGLRIECEGVDGPAVLQLIAHTVRDGGAVDRAEWWPAGGAEGGATVRLGHALQAGDEVILAAVSTGQAPIDSFCAFSPTEADPSPPPETNPEAIGGGCTTGGAAAACSPVFGALLSLWTRRAGRRRVPSPAGAAISR